MMFAALHAAGNPALLLECARYFSPRVEITSPDTVLIDISGLGHLFGTPAQIAQAMANRAGIPVNVGVSADADSAVYAARGIKSITVIPVGQEAAALAHLPLNLLPGSPGLAESLHSWGIRTFGQLAALPPLGVAARLGEEGTHLQRLAKGEAGRHFRDLIDPATFDEQLELDHRVELLEPLSFLFSKMLTNLTERLLSRGLSANEIRLELTLEAAPPHRCTLNLPVPMRDPQAFLKLLQLELNARPPVAPILKIRLALNPVPPRPQQDGLFLPSAPQPEKLEITLARLTNLLGGENVGTPELIDTHRPDSFRMKRFAALVTKVATPPIRETPVLRRFRPALHTQVLLQDSRPAHISSMHVQSKVLDASGPWRSSGDWWLPEPWDHKEWDIALANGVFYRLYEDCRTARWFLEGHYD